VAYWASPAAVGSGEQAARASPRTPTIATPRERIRIEQGRVARRIGDPFVERAKAARGVAFLSAPWLP
jgi:hypothetical protein